MIEYTWQDLEYEIGKSADAGLTVEFWWRDDDAADDVGALKQLTALAASEGVPLAAAVIPAALTDEGAARLLESDQVTVLQHGFAHTNHAGPAEKKAELGDHRPADAVLAELRAGSETLQTAFGARALPVLVPPWNRISDTVTGGLANAGFAGLSLYKPRETETPADGVLQVNSHIDLIDWRVTRKFIGTGAALAHACEHIAAKREGRADAAEPTGLLTHHLVMDMAAWAFAGTFIRRTRNMPGVLWPEVAAVFNGVAPGED